MIIYGWKIKPIDVLEIDRSDFNTRCKKHNLFHRYIIGKKYLTIYFIPINYFFAKERVFRICEKCKEEYEEESPEVESLLLQFYHKKITSKDLNYFLDEIIKNRKDKHKKIIEEDTNNFKEFIKYFIYFIVVVIVIFILKYSFK